MRPHILQLCPLPDWDQVPIDAAFTVHCLHQAADPAALLEALENNRIAGAALDVFEGEPAVNPRFLGLTNVLLQPHIASATVQTRQAMGQLMRANLTAHFAGQPLLTPVP